MLSLLFNQQPADTTAPTVTASPIGGDVTAMPTVTLTASEPATIYYTLDGSTPTTASTVYSAPVAITGLITTLKYFGVDTAGNASAVQSQTYTKIIVPSATPPTAWQNSAVPVAPGASGSWKPVPAPVVPTRTPLAPLYGLTSYTITLNSVDVTAQVSACHIEESEGSALATCTLDIPVGMVINQGDAVDVTIAGMIRRYLVTEVSPSGPKRSAWCRSRACLLDAPYKATQSWNGWDTPHATANALAATLCGTVALTWSLPDWKLPDRWELSGTPIEALQALAAAAGGIVCSNPDGGITCRRRWPVRPPDLAAEVAVDTVSRDTVIGSGLSAKASPGKGYGTVTVYGYDPSPDLPDLEVEEQSPAIGTAVHVRVFWRTTTPPGFASFVTDGLAAQLASGTVQLTEEVTFDNGRASVKYPIRKLHGYTWIGQNQGAIWWQETGDSRELSTATPGARGIASITYTAGYDRWELTGQTAAKCLFGVDVSQGQVSAKVNYTSGGSIAPAVTAALINDTAGCVEAGTAFLDSNRAFIAVSAELPLTTTDISRGATVQVTDAVTGVIGKGKVVTASISLEARKTTRRLEVQVPC